MRSLNQARAFPDIPPKENSSIVPFKRFWSYEPRQPVAHSGALKRTSASPLPAAVGAPAGSQAVSPADLASLVAVRVFSSVIIVCVVP